MKKRGTQVNNNTDLANVNFTIHHPHRKQAEGKLILPSEGTCCIKVNSYLDVSGSITIEEEVLIQEDVKIYTHNHDWHNALPPHKVPLIKKDLHIGKAAFIGANSVLICVEQIGKYAVIGAGSVLTKSVGDYEVWAGNPAKFLYKRVDK